MRQWSFADPPAARPPEGGNGELWRSGGRAQRGMGGEITVATNSVSGVFKAVSAVLTVAFAYLGVAVAAGWPPFGSATEITMVFPKDDFKVSDNFTVELSGSLASDSDLWVMALDSNQMWYPLGPAVAASPGHWRIEIKSRQIVSDVNLCAIRVENAASAGLSDYARRGKSLPMLPAGSDQQACAGIEPAQP
jgi:hypothetical protein